MGARRDEIVDIARRLFADGGVRTTSIRDLAAAAGVLPSSLYSHFTSKIDLVDEIMRPYALFVIAECRRAEAEVADPIERLRELIRTAMELAETHPMELAIHQKDAAFLIKDERFSYFGGIRDAVRESWLGAITEATEAGRIRNDLPPEVLYRWIRDAVYFSFLWFDPAEGFTAGELGRGAADLFLNGLLVRHEDGPDTHV